MKNPNPKATTAYSATAVEETLRLYDGWLSYLLIRLGLDTVRVEADELRHALKTLSCHVERDGSGYVIRLSTGGKKEATHERAAAESAED